MAIEICTVGGFSEIGRNMTAVKIDDSVILLDMGIHLENYIALTEDEDVVNIHPITLIENKAVPDIHHIRDWLPHVKAIVPTHAHLDHIGAIPFLAQYYPEVPIVCTPFTEAVLRAIITDTKIKFKNPFKILNPNSAIKINSEITIEFVSITHSIPQTVVIVLHTKYGKVVYANDFKFDAHPIIGTKANTKRLHEIGKTKEVKCLIMDSLYSNEQKKTPSELVAREMLKDVMLGTHCEGKAIIITTFSSHIARLKSIVDFSKELKRKVVFIGRSLAKYSLAADTIGITELQKQVEIVPFGSKVGPRLKKIMKEGPEKYVIVATGHQAEPNSALVKMINGLFQFNRGDIVIFSSTVIPADQNIRNRHELDERFVKLGVRLFTDIHVSGHAAREDHRDMIDLLNPTKIIPAHGDKEITKGINVVIEQMGLSQDTVIQMEDGQRITL